MRTVRAAFSPNCTGRVCRVVLPAQLASEWVPELDFVILAQSDAEAAVGERIVAGGARNVAWVKSEGLQSGDVIAPDALNARAIVLLRESDTHHALQLTNRCNSNCLMCSQPPTPEFDGWRVDQAMQAIAHLRWAPLTLGLTGGEPLLLGESFRQVLDAVSRHHPATTIEVLTNGRLLGRPGAASRLLPDPSAKVSWLVPVYGHADFLHDFIVQSPGAFDETIGGLLTLQEHGQPVQLRIVLIQPVLENLVELCRFIGRNLPFVREVALMGCEPIGFALANKEACQVDLQSHGTTLCQAARQLQRFGIPFLLMNTPLCAIPRELWPFARRSISDWKNSYAGECADCSAREDCCGLFAWHEQGWKPSPLKAITKGET